jgi:hypothetical protein
MVTGLDIGTHSDPLRQLLELRPLCITVQRKEPRKTND